MCTVSDQVTQEIHQSLKSMGLSPLSSDNTASLIGQLQNIAKKENCVRSVIGERTHAWVVLMIEGGAPAMDVGISRLRLQSFTAHSMNRVHPTRLSHSRLLRNLCV